MSLENFEVALQFLFPAEGRYVNNKNDKGGPTNMGVTQSTYNSYRKTKGLDLQSVKNITQKEAINLYYENYWKASGADNIEDTNFAVLVFDTAVLHGPYSAKRFYKLSGGDINKFLDIRRTSYDQIVAKEPSQKEFYNGWINRVIRLKKNVDNNVFNEDAEKIKIHDKNTVYINQLESEMFNYSKENESLLNTKSKQVIEEKFVLSDVKGNLLKKLKNLVKKLQALFEGNSQSHENSETNNNPNNYVYEDKVEEQPQKTQNDEPEDDGLVVIPDKYKDKSNGENAEEPQLPYEKRVEVKAYSPEGELIKESNDSEDQEPEINPEYLKPIELEEDGMATGGAAGISDKFVNPNSYNRDSVEYPETSLGDEELPMPSAKNKFDFFENSMKELMKHTKKFSYDANAGKLDSITLLNRKLDKINKNLESMQQQLDYHEKVVNIYNTPELAAFYLHDVVDKILADLLDEYILMMGYDTNL